jgi:hypothetical protein
MWVSRAELRRVLAQNKALKAQVSALEAELREERLRGRRREDELVDRVLTAAGRHALTPDPAVTPPKKPAPPKPLTAMEEARLAALRQAALDAGRPTQEADALFYAQRNGTPFQVAQPSEPYVELH